MSLGEWVLVSVDVLAWSEERRVSGRVLMASYIDDQVCHLVLTLLAD